MPIRYFVSQNGEVKGPFDLDLIEVFILSGHYPQDVLICAEGSDEWHRRTISNPASRSSTGYADSAHVGKPPRGVLKPGFVAVGVLGLIVLAAIFTGNENTGSPHSSATTSSVPTKTDAETPKAFNQAQKIAYQDGSRSRPANTVADADGTSRTYYPTPAATPAAILYTSTDGRTHSVPHSDYVRLLRQKKALDQEDSAMTAAQTRLDEEQSSLERQRAYLDRTNQYEVDDFNEKIDALNLRKAQVRQQVSTFNESVDSFNAELARVGTLVR
jgi:hypothetical protein